MNHGLHYSLSKSIITNDDVIKWLEGFIREYEILKNRLNDLEQNESTKIAYNDTVVIIKEFNVLIIKLKDNKLARQDKIDLINYLNKARKNIEEEGGDIGGIERYIQDLNG